MKFLSNILVKAGLVVEDTFSANAASNTIYAGSGTRLRTEANNLVFERVSSSGTMKMMFTQGTLSPTAKAYIGYSNATLNLILANEYATAGLELRTSDIIRQQIFANGNIVIGQSSPVDAGYKVDITGTTRITSTVTLVSLSGTGDRMVVVNSSGVLSTQAIVNPSAVLPVGGTTGQILAKIDNTNYNTEWIDNYTGTVKHIVKAGVALTKGQAVYVSSADGTNMVVSKASNATESTSSKTMGLIAQNLSTNGTGFIVTEGLLSGLDTSSAQAGDPVWLGTDGNLLFGLANKPYAPNHLVYIGVVTRVQQNNGEIFVSVQNGFELNEIHNVQITSTPSDNTVLAYEASTSLYKMKSIATLLGFTPVTNARALTINGTAYDLTADRSWSVGTTTGSGSTGQVAYWNGSSSQTGTNNFFWDATNNRLGIGLVNPQRALEIYSTTADSHLRLSGSAPSVSLGEAITGSIYQAKFGLATANGQYAAGAVAGDFVIISQTGATIFSTGAIEKMRVSTAGNVSINSTNDTYKFDVTGTGRFSGQLRLESTITNGTYTYTLPSATGTLALLSDIPSGGITGSGTTDTIPLFSSMSGIANSVITQSTGTQSIGIGSFATPYSVIGYGQYYGSGFVKNGASGDDILAGNGGLITAGTGITISGGTISATSSGGITGSGTPNYIAKFAGTGTAIGDSLIYDNGTNVGIGTTSPSYTLDVNGTGRFGGNLTSSPLELANTITSNYLFINSATGYEAMSRYYNPTAGNWYTGIRANAGLGSTSSYHIFSSAYSGGDVFVLNTDGTAKFASSVTATQLSAYGASNANVIIAGVNSGSNNPRFFVKADESINTVYAFSSSSTGSDNLSLGSGGGTSIYIKAGGNVGIGTTSPTSFASNTLQINGATSSSIKVTNTSGGTGNTDGLDILQSIVDTYIWNRSTGFISLGTANTERMRITSGGNVLVSTTTSIASVFKLQVGDGTSDTRSFFNPSNAFAIGVANGGSSAWYIGVNAQTAANGLQFYSNNLGGVAMTINTTGNVNIGNTANDFGSRQVNYSTSSYTFHSVRTGTGSEGHLVFSNANGAVGSIFTNGSATSYNTSSDYRLKTDFKDFSGLDLLTKIKTYDYEWKADKTRSYGVIAHELQSVINYAVTGVKDGKEMQGVDYSKLVPVLIKSIQELKQELDILKNK